jgi:hypothetical protein
MPAVSASPVAKISFSDCRSPVALRRATNRWSVVLMPRSSSAKESTIDPVRIQSP